MTATPEIRPGRVRRPTATAAFGSSRRESHDASGFYRRFVPPDVSGDETVQRTKRVDVVYRRDSRDMSSVESNSIALVVTSPPYFAGKEYEESLGQNGVPGTYFEYLGLLKDVFAECRRVLEPGGRIAVNVANLGRRPYRSLAGDVVDILQELGLLLRGEVVWWKGRAAGGSCAWGTFQRPNNPVLRDITERIVIGSKGRFDRAIRPEKRFQLGLPSTSTISRDEFLEATTDLWEIPAESATRVGHPAPFPVELPARLIDLFTYEGDVVLDPFMGSGTTAVAAVRGGRHFIGFDTDASYVARAKDRIKQERDRLVKQDVISSRVRIVAASEPVDGGDAVARGLRDGLQAKELAGILLDACGFSDVRSDVKIPGAGLGIHFLATDRTGQDWAFDVSGAFTSNRSGLKRAETLWRAIGRATVLHQARPDLPLVLLTTDRPNRGSAGHLSLEAVTGADRPVFDLVELLDVGGHDRLGAYALRGRPAR
jgi:site-specific DNA-methyltransferase (adenine-specific)